MAGSLSCLQLNALTKMLDFGLRFDELVNGFHGEKGWGFRY